MSVRAIHPGDPAGAIDLCVVVVHGRVRAVEIDSTRPVNVTGTLVGQPIESALGMLRLLFSVCSAGHSIAALSACEAALKIVPSAAQLGAREVVLCAENLDNHAWELLVEWPRLDDLAVSAPTLSALRTATHRCVAALRDPGWLHLGGGAPRPDRAAIERAIATLDEGVAGLLGGPLPRHLDELIARARAGQGAAAPLVARIVDEGLEGFGATDVPLLPELPPHFYAERLSRHSDFDRWPTIDGVAAETGPLAELRTHPLVDDVVSRHGPGVLARVVARLVALGSAPMKARAVAARLRDGEPVARDASVLRGYGSGVGVVDTARGRLVHAIVVDDGHVIAWRTVAPTEWNFHPDGPFTQGLVGQSAEGIAARATLLAASLSPCVPFSVRVEERAEMEVAHA